MSNQGMDDHRKPGDSQQMPPLKTAKGAASIADTAPGAAGARQGVLHAGVDGLVRLPRAFQPLGLVPMEVWCLVHWFPPARIEGPKLIHFSFCLSSSPASRTAP